MFPQAWDWTRHPGELTLGLFGGTFDPVHHAHLMAAEIVRSSLGLSKIIFMPSATAPHKTSRSISVAEHRWNMLQLAIAGHSGFAVSALELERGGTSFTVDTLSILHDHFGCRQANLYLIIGADNLQDLHTWKNPQQLFELAQIVAVNRPSQKQASLNSPLSDRVQHVVIPMMDISATAIRERVRAGQSIRYWTPDAVIEYIRRHCLYSRDEA